MVNMCYFMTCALPLVVGTVGYIKDMQAKYIGLASLFSVGVLQVMQVLCSWREQLCKLNPPAEFIS